MTNEEKNIVIAEFIGYQKKSYELWTLPEHFESIEGLEYSEEWHRKFVFDCDWNWLMKAWGKFRDLEGECIEHEYPTQGFGETHFEYIARTIAQGTIIESFEALYEGINWYTNLSNPSHH